MEVRMLDFTKERAISQLSQYMRSHSVWTPHRIEVLLDEMQQTERLIAGLSGKKDCTGAGHNPR